MHYAAKSGELTERAGLQVAKAPLVCCRTQLYKARVTCCRAPLYKLHVAKAPLYKVHVAKARLYKVHVVRISQTEHRAGKARKTMQRRWYHSKIR